MTKFAWTKNVYTGEKTRFFGRQDIVDEYDCKYHTYIHLKDTRDDKWYMIGVYSDDDIKTFFKACYSWCRGMRGCFETIGFRIRTYNDNWNKYQRYYV